MVFNLRMARRSIYCRRHCANKIKATVNPEEQPVAQRPLMPPHQVNYGAWLLKVVAWDGLMPIVVLLIPEIVERLFEVDPKNWTA